MKNCVSLRNKLWEVLMVVLEIERDFMQTKLASLFKNETRCHPICYYQNYYFC